MSYTWGDRALHMGNASPDLRLELMLDGVARIHGNDVYNLVDGGDSIAWHTYPWTQGAFSQPAAGELQLYHAAAQRAEGVLYFSGEHLSADPGWIHGSIDSTESVVKTMLNAM